jgi:hypothetical protein
MTAERIGRRRNVVGREGNAMLLVFLLLAGFILAMTGHLILR